MDKLQKDFNFPKNKPTVTPNLHGWLGEGNQLLLKKYITNDCKLIFEFGSWLGLSADYILNNTNSCKNCKVVCIDTWEGDWSIKQTNKYKKHLQNLYDTFIVNMWKWKDRLIPVKMDGRQAMKYLHDLGLKPDLIYLDMDHSYESAKGDLKLLMKYFPDTLILGDDILYWKGVAQAVKEIVREYKIFNLEINKNCYALIPSWYSKKFKLNELIMKTIKPKDQYIDFKVAIIAGYHEKYHTKSQLDRFITYMNNFMKKTDLEYKIFVLTQFNKEIDLNLGHLYNIGFELAESEGYSKFVFSDLYLLPHEEMIPYYKRNNKYPIHIGYHWNKFNYELYYLGIIMFNKENFELINGYPINIFGLYGWDYEVILRLKDTGLKLKIPEYGKIIDNGTHPNISIAEWKKIKTSTIINQHSETWKSNGLKNTFYTMENMKNITNGCKNCKIYTVSLVDYKYYLVNTEDIVYEFTEKVDKEPEIEIFFSDKPEEPSKELGYIESDNKLIRKYENTIARDARLLDITFAHSLLIINTFQYKKVWKNNDKLQKNNNKLLDKYNFYIYNILSYISNKFNHIKNNKFNYFNINSISKSQINNNIILSHKNRIINTIQLLLKKKNKNFNINYYESYYSNFDIPNNIKINYEKAIYSNFENYNDYEKLIKLVNGNKFDLLFFSLKDSKLLIQLHLLYKLLNLKGSCILKILIPSIFKKRITIIYNLLRYSFKTVKIVYSKIQSARQRVIFIVCDYFTNIATNFIKQMNGNIFQHFNKLKNINNYYLKINTNVKLVTFKYINFTQTILLNYYSNLLKIIYLYKLNNKKLYKKMYKYKLIVYNKYIEQLK